MLIGGDEVYATGIMFHADGVIQEGDVYDYAFVYDDAIVDMTGGVVVGILGAYDFSTVNISGGVIGKLDSMASGTFNLSGDMSTNSFVVNGSCTANVFGGNVGLIEAWSSNSVNLHGGVISDYLLAVSTVNIYGYGFDYDPLAGSYGGGQLTGFWVDDTPFSIDLFAASLPGGGPIDTWSHIVLVPEPATILLLSLGGLFLRKRN